MEKGKVGFYLIISVTNNSRTPRTDVVNVLISIDVPHARPFHRIDHNWLATHRFEGTNWGVHTSRQQLLTSESK